MTSCHSSSTTAIRMWYQYLTIHSVNHGIYVHPYYCFRPEANKPKWLISVNDTNTIKHDLPDKYSTMLYEWGNNIYTALSNEKFTPKDCDTQKFIIWNHYSSGYEDLYYLISENHPNNLNHTIDLISEPPTQFKSGYQISKYLHRYKYYLELRAYLKNDSATLYDTDKLDTLMLGANHFFKFRRRSHE